MQDYPDQAHTLRRIAESEVKMNSSENTPRVIAVTSGKGGVGKTNVVTNIAYLFSSAGKRVFVLDADIGLANIDVMLGLTPEYNLQHVFCGEKTLADIIVEGPGGMKILPASSGVQELAELTQEQKLHLLSEFSTLTDSIDLFLIDTGAGISSNVMYFNMAAQDRIVIVTPEPTSITDAYAIMKVMSKKYSVARFSMIVNQVRNEQEARQLYSNLSGVAEQFLNISIDYLGYIVADGNVTRSVKHQQPVSVLYPESPASLCYVQLAKKILTRMPSDQPSGTIGFFWSSILGNALQ